MADLLEIARLALDTGRLNRATFDADGCTPETVTTHTTMLGLLAMEVAAEWFFATGINPCRVAVFALVHDLVEARTPGGDTCTFAITAEALADKERREAIGLQRLKEEFSGTWLLQRIREYERQESLETQFVRYLDKVTPKLTHALNGCAAIKAMGKTRADLVEAHRAQGARLRLEYPELASIVGPIFDEACRRAEESWDD